MNPSIDEVKAKYLEALNGNKKIELPQWATIVLADLSSDYVVACKADHKHTTACIDAELSNDMRNAMANAFSLGFILNNLARSNNWDTDFRVLSSREEAATQPQPERRQRRYRYERR